MKLIMQDQTTECGLACLAMIASRYGLSVDLRTLRQSFPISARGSTLIQIIEIAEQLNFLTRSLRIDMDSLSMIKMPCILHWDFKHFVVLKSIRRGKATILDPAAGEMKIGIHEVAKHFTGVVLELTPGPLFLPQSVSPKIALSSIAGKVFGLKRTLLKIFLLSLTLEALIIFAPLFQQLAIDQAVSSGDYDLLSILSAGFALLLGIQILIGIGRSWTLLVISQSLALVWSRTLFNHTLKLPISFFERRHAADVISKFGSLGTIQSFMTTSAAEATLDGVMAVATLTMMFAYSSTMVVPTLVAVVFYISIRILIFFPLKLAAAEKLALSARESAHFIESLRNVLSIKIFGKRGERARQWQNFVIDVQNRDIKTAKLSAIFSSSKTFVFGLEGILVFWLGASEIMHSEKSGSSFSIGMLFAYLSYKTIFTARASKLVDYFFDLRMLSVHAERLADISLSAPEFAEQPAPSTWINEGIESIEAKNLGFFYEGANSPTWVFRNVNFCIRAREFVALSGQSGSGKTTLLKIIAGLYLPTEGELRINGRVLSAQDLPHYRNYVATVMQDEMLFSGTLEENISFMSESIDQHNIELCARSAQIHEDICSMPMGYHTYIGDMGSGISGGQKQRILIARSLYKASSILLLDEATSHLDEATEKRIVDSLSSLPAIRVAIAHRPSTLEHADRVLVCENGSVSELGDGSINAM